MKNGEPLINKDISLIKGRNGNDSTAYEYQNYKHHQTAIKSSSINLNQV
jgi:hypothetical protein